MFKQHWKPVDPKAAQELFWRLRGRRMPVLSRRIAVAGLVLITITGIVCGTAAQIVTGHWPETLGFVLSATVGALAGITIPLRNAP